VIGKASTYFVKWSMKVSKYLFFRGVVRGATAVLVLQDGRQRNSDPTQVVFRDILGTEMKMYRVAIAQVD